MKPIELTKEIARKVATSINGALCSGAGNGEGQNVCVMQAIARAVGRPVTDDTVEECVGFAVSAFNRRLNDCEWSSPEARAKGMKRLGVGSIGSNQIDQKQFGELMFLRGTQKLLPLVFRKVADDKEIKAEQRAQYLEHASKCGAVKTFDEAKDATKDASASAYAYASASAYAYASAYASASAYAYAYAYAYASASAYAYAYASASAYASAYAYASASFKKNLGDALLIATAELALSVLVELKSPGCEWLDLCE